MGSSDLSGGSVRSGSIDSAENMSVAVLMVCRIDAAMSQVQFVDGECRGRPQDWGYPWIHKESDQRGPVGLRFGLPFRLGWVHV
jgi:hypothetical protein